MPIFTKRSRANTLQIISARLSETGTVVTFASDTSFLWHTSTSWEGWLGRCGGSVLWFLGTILGFVGGNCIGLLRTLAFFLANGNKYLFLLRHHSIPFDSWPLLLIQFSHAHGVKVSQSKFLIYSPLHHGFQLLINEHRHLLMNHHVSKFQFCFVLIGLTCRQFLQTFQDITGWNLRHRQWNFVPSCIDFLNVVIMKS